jgi:hypothetical protein
VIQILGWVLLMLGALGLIPIGRRISGLPCTGAPCLPVAIEQSTDVFGWALNLTTVVMGVLVMVAGAAVVVAPILWDRQSRLD